MSSAVLNRPRCRQALLSDQSYYGYGYEPLPPRRQSVPPITVEAEQPFTAPFGEGQFDFEQEPPLWFRLVLNKVCALGDLQFNWNSYGAMPIDPETAVATLQIILNVLSENDPQPAVVPTSGGGILLEWHVGGIDLEVDVRSPSSIHVAFEVDGREEEFENVDVDLIQDKLNVLRGRL